MLDLSLPTGVRTVDYLDYVPLLYRVAIGIKRDGEAIGIFLLQRLRFEQRYFVHHIQNLEIFFLQSDDDADFLRLDLHHVAPLELSERVNAGGAIRTQLKIFWQDLEFVHGKIGEEYNE